jgi:hypothetical protein
MIPLDRNPPHYWAGQISYVFFSAQGIYMPLLRISEPYFYSVVARNIRNIKRSLKGEPPETEEDRTRSTDSITSKESFMDAPSNSFIDSRQTFQT